MSQDNSQREQYPHCNVGNNCSMEISWHEISMLDHISSLLELVRQEMVAGTHRHLFARRCSFLNGIKIFSLCRKRSQNFEAYPEVKFSSRRSLWKWCPFCFTIGEHWVTIRVPSRKGSSSRHQWKRFLVTSGVSVCQG